MKKNIIEMAVKEFEKFDKSYFKILLYVLLGLFLIFLIDEVFKPLFCWKCYFTWEAIALFITAYFIYRQSKSTKELVSVTLRPHISVGVKLLYKEQGLAGTRLIFNNLSNFNAFVWTKINLKINDANRNNLLRNNPYFLGKRPWEIAPQEVIAYLSPFEPADNDYITEKITFIITFCVNSIPELPDEPRWIELTPFSFRMKEWQWLRDGLGMPFIIFRDGKRFF